jgi:hypothetical protein
MIRPELINTLKLPAMGQLGIVVKSIEQSLPYYKSLMNIHSWHRPNFVEEKIYYKDRHIDLNLNVAIGYSGPLQFELIEVMQGEENIYTKLIKTRKEGLHHVGFFISNIEKKTELLRKSGFYPIQYGILKTTGKALIRFAYFDTVKSCGYIIELIETKLFGISVGQSRFMIKLGKFLGDIEAL